MMTKDQVVIMDLLKDFECLRYQHIEKYMHVNRGSTTAQVSKMVSQLRHMGNVMNRNGLVSLPHRPPDLNLLAAFDVMLEITAGKKAEITIGNAPYILYFSVNSKKNSGFHGIVVATQGKEHSIAVKVEKKRGTDMTHIIILHSHEQRQFFAVMENVFYVMHDGNKYRYFSGRE